MYQSKLIEYLSHFSKTELKRFETFVHSSFFNKHVKTKALLDYILSVSAWDSSSLSIEKGFAALFPNEAFDEQKLRTVMSYLVQLIHRFYSQEELEENKNTLHIGLLERALDRDQQKMFELQSNSWQRLIQKSQVRDSAYFLNASKYHRLQDTFDLKFGKRKEGHSLAKAIEHFDTFYISEKFRMVCEMLVRKQVMGQEYSFVLIDMLRKQIESNEAYFKKVPSIWLYFLIYKMITDKESAYFFELKDRLKEDAIRFKQAEGRDLYTHALNFCIGRLNFGEVAFKQELFELYQQMLTAGFLYIDGVLPQWDYTNIVSTGCDLQKSDWVKEFIHKQKEFLTPGVRENTFTYNLAAYYYAQSQYAEAQLLLQKVEFTDIYYNLLSRIVLLKIYVETQSWDTLEYFLETFRIYLLRNKQIGAARQKSGLNLIKYTRNLLRIIEQQSIDSEKEFQRKCAALQAKIASNDKVLNKSWLLNTLEKSSKVD